MKHKYKHKFPLIYVAVTAVLVVLSALLGYYLTKRYKETITDTYNTAVSNISEKINEFQGDVADEISKLENNEE